MKNFAHYSHPVHGLRVVRLDGRHPRIYDGVGGWRFVTLSATHRV